MLKSMLSIEPVHVIVAITDNDAGCGWPTRLRGLWGEFFTAFSTLLPLRRGHHWGGCVSVAGAVVHPDATVGSHCYLGPGSVVDRDAEVGAGSWISAGCVVGPGPGRGEGRPRGELQRRAQGLVSG